MSDFLDREDDVLAYFDSPEDALAFAAERGCRPGRLLNSPNARERKHYLEKPGAVLFDDRLALQEDD